MNKPRNYAVVIVLGLVVGTLVASATSTGDAVADATYLRWKSPGSTAGAPVSTEGPWECGRINDYRDLVTKILKEDPDLSVVFEDDEFDPMTLSSPELEALGIQVQEAGERMKDADPKRVPIGLEELHDAWSSAIVMIGRLYEDMGREGFLVILVYENSINEFNTGLATGLALAERRCPTEFDETSAFWPTPGGEE